MAFVSETKNNSGLNQTVTSLPIMVRPAVPGWNVTPGAAAVGPWGGVLGPSLMGTAQTRWRLRVCPPASRERHPGLGDLLGFPAAHSEPHSQLRPGTVQGWRAKSAQGKDWRKPSRSFQESSSQRVTQDTLISSSNVL